MVWLRSYRHSLAWGRIEGLEDQRNEALFDSASEFKRGKGGG